MKAINAKKELSRYASTKRKATNEWFFKTEKGQYGYGDKFIGVSMPDCRKVVAQFKDLSLPEVKKLLYSKIHEERMLAVLILVVQFRKADKSKIYNFYLKHRKQVNNWDLVDSSAHKIVGGYLLTQPKSARKILDNYAKSKDLWTRRIAIIATMAFIYKEQFDDTLRISKILLNDKHDLIHKAVGWMLREVGKKDLATEEKFLKKHYKKMPRTMLRYAIEKFPEVARQRYLKGAI